MTTDRLLQVYEEKERTWERELKKIRDLYEARLKQAQQKAHSLEQSLAAQSYQVTCTLALAGHKHHVVCQLYFMSRRQLLLHFLSAAATGTSKGSN